MKVIQQKVELYNEHNNIVHYSNRKYWHDRDKGIYLYKNILPYRLVKYINITLAWFNNLKVNKKFTVFIMQNFIINNKAVGIQKLNIERNFMLSFVKNYDQADYYKYESEDRGFKKYKYVNGIYIPREEFNNDIPDNIYLKLEYENNDFIDELKVLAQNHKTEKNP